MTTEARIAYPLRLPSTLWKQLVKQAKKQSMSFNALITSILTKHLG